jgi:hypothetical protein
MLNVSGTAEGPYEPEFGEALVELVEVGQYESGRPYAVLEVLDSLGGQGKVRLGIKDQVLVHVQVKEGSDAIPPREGG